MTVVNLGRSVSMWRYKGFGATKPPSPKRPKTTDDRRQTQHKYEHTSRERSIQESWKKGREWLKVDENDVMRCTTCIDVGKSHPRIVQHNVFASEVGCTLMPFVF